MKANRYIKKNTKSGNDNHLSQNSHGGNITAVVEESSDAAITRLPGRRIDIAAEYPTVRGKTRGRILYIFSFALFCIHPILSLVYLVPVGDSVTSC